MDPQIEYFLSKVVNRYRSQRWAWLLAGCWLLVAVAILAGWVPLPKDLTGDWQKYALPLGIFVGVIGLLWVASRFAYRDLQVVAKQVENSFPTLEQKLLTSTTSSIHASPYFRRRVVQDVVRHAQAFDWTNVVAPWRFWMAWGTQWLAFAGMIAAIAITSISKSDGVMPSASLNALLRDADTWIVEPGDTEIERGSDLFVTLRLGQANSRSGEIEASLWTKASETSSKLPMSRALNDALYGAAIRRVDADLDYRVEAEGRSSRTYQVKVFEFPALVRSDAVIVPPSYANQPEKRIEDTRKVTVAEGAQLTWECRLNKQVERAELIDEQGESTSLESVPEEPNLYRAVFVMDQSKRWKLKLVDLEGRSAKFEEMLSARVIPNKPPAIQLARPSDQRVSALQEIDLAATITDDYAIRKVGLSFTLSGDEMVDVVLLESDDVIASKNKQDVAHTISLEDWNAKPDQLLSYHFWMEDWDRDGKPRRIDGDMFFAEVRPFEELFRQGQGDSQNSSSRQNQGSQAAGMAEELAELQKKIMSGTWNTIREFAEATSTSRQKAIETLIESQQQARLQSEKLSETIENEASVAIVQEVQDAMDQATETLQKGLQDSSTDSLRQSLKAERAAYEGLLRLRSREFEINQSQQSQSQSRSQSSSQSRRQQQIEQLKIENDPTRYESESKPDTPDEAAQREMRQVMNRLDELARRQQDLNDQLRELDLALQAAKTEEAKKEIEEELKRLRDSQQEMLQDTDELLDRMNQESNQQSMQESRQQMEEAREQLQQSAQAIQEQQPSSAVASGSRAQQAMEQTREALRQQSAQGLQDEMRQLMQQADDLERQQQKLQQRLPSPPQQDPTQQKSPQDDGSPQNSVLRPGAENGSDEAVAEAWKDQREALEQLLENIKGTVTESESSEPVLAEELYETYRQAQQSRLKERLEQTGQLLQRGLDEPARELAEKAGQEIRQLREQIEKSSESVLGSEAESLNRALRELDRARGQLEPEKDGEQASPEPRDDVPASQREGSPTSQREGPSRLVPSSQSPIVGQEFNQWTDAIREVEELVRDPELKAEAARIREAAREMRVDYRRHSKIPQWPLVQRMIAEPMDLLRAKIAQELLRRTAEKNQIVPLDRDPVPRQFQSALDRYFERLGSENAKP